MDISVCLLRIKKTQLEETIGREMTNERRRRCIQEEQPNQKRGRQPSEPPTTAQMNKAWAAAAKNGVSCESDADAWNSDESDIDHQNNTKPQMRNSHGEIVDKDYAARL